MTAQRCISNLTKLDNEKKQTNYAKSNSRRRPGKKIVTEVDNRQTQRL